MKNDCKIGYRIVTKEIGWNKNPDEDRDGLFTRLWRFIGECKNTKEVWK